MYWQLTEVTLDSQILHTEKYLTLWLQGRENFLWQMSGEANHSSSTWPGKEQNLFLLLNPYFLKAHLSLGNTHNITNGKNPKLHKDLIHSHSYLLGQKTFTCVLTSALSFHAFSTYSTYFINLCFPSLSALACIRAFQTFRVCIIIGTNILQENSKSKY